MLNINTSFALVDIEKGKVIWQLQKVAACLLDRVRDVRGEMDPEYRYLSHQRGVYTVEGALTFVARGATKCPTTELFVNKRPLPPCHDLIQLLTSIDPEATSFAAAPVSRKGDLNMAPSF